MFVQFDFLAQIIKIHNEAMKSESLGVFFELKNLLGKF
jgi:hypothetical protein